MSQDDESGTFSRSLRENSRRHRSLYGDTWLYQDLGCSRIEKHSCRVIHSCTRNCFVLFAQERAAD